MAIDWESIAKIGASVATIVAAGTAIYGVSAWRREHIGKRKAELAEETLANFYHATDAIKMMRSPGTYTDEGTSRKAPPGESAEERKAMDRAHVLLERYNSNADLFSRLRAARYRFIALFGRPAAKPFEDLNAVVLDLVLAAQMLGDLWAERSERRAPQRPPGLRKADLLASQRSGPDRRQGRSDRRGDRAHVPPSDPGGRPHQLAVRRHQIWSRANRASAARVAAPASVATSASGKGSGQEKGRRRPFFESVP